MKHISAALTLPPIQSFWHWSLSAAACFSAKLAMSSQQVGTRAEVLPNTQAHARVWSGPAHGRARLMTTAPVGEAKLSTSNGAFHQLETDTQYGCDLHLEVPCEGVGGVHAGACQCLP